MDELFDSVRRIKGSLPVFEVKDLWYNKTADIFLMNYTPAGETGFNQSSFDAVNVKETYGGLI